MKIYTLVKIAIKDEPYAPEVNVTIMGHSKKRDECEDEKYKNIRIFINTYSENKKDVYEQYKKHYKYLTYELRKRMTNKKMEEIFNKLNIGEYVNQTVTYSIVENELDLQ